MIIFPTFKQRNAARALIFGYAAKLFLIIAIPYLIWLSIAPLRKG